MAEFDRPSRQTVGQTVWVSLGWPNFLANCRTAAPGKSLEGTGLGKSGRHDAVDSASPLLSAACAAVSPDEVQHSPGTCTIGPIFWPSGRNVSPTVCLCAMLTKLFGQVFGQTVVIPNSWAKNFLRLRRKTPNTVLRCVLVLRHSVAISILNVCHLVSPRLPPSKRALRSAADKPRTSGGVNFVRIGLRHGTWAFAVDTLAVSSTRAFRA